MLVQIKTNLGYQDYPELPFVMEGDEREVPESVGIQLVKRGHAVEVIDDSPKKQKQPGPKAIEPQAETKPTK